MNKVIIKNKSGDPVLVEILKEKMLKNNTKAFLGKVMGEEKWLVFIKNESGEFVELPK